MNTSTASRLIIPANYFGVALGTLALSLAWRYAASINLMPAAPGVFLQILAVTVWATLAVLYLYKWLVAPAQALAETRHPIMGGFVALVPVTTLETAMVLLPISRVLATILMVIGVVGQLAYAAYRTPFLWQGNHQLQATTPAIYIPTVASNFASAALLGQMGYTDMGWLFLGAGVLSWLSLEPAILRRLRTEESIPPEKRGLLGVQIAPAFVCNAALFSLNGGVIDIFILFLTGYGTLQLIYFLRLAPWILEKGFMIGLWGFSFAFGAMATTGAHLVYENRLVALGWGLFWLGTVLIGLLWCGNLYLWFGALTRAVKK